MKRIWGAEEKPGSARKCDSDDRSELEIQKWVFRNWTRARNIQAHLLESPFRFSRFGKYAIYALSRFDVCDKMGDDHINGGKIMRPRTDESGLMRRVQYLAAAFLLAACSGQPEQEASGNALPADPVVAEDEEVILDVWLERLEVGSRELYSARDAVLASVDLAEGDIVADIGAGTGLYSLMFADAVGASGHVYAVDIEPLFLDLINRRAEDLGLYNITAVLGRQNDVSLPVESVDVVFVADTYHYFENREEIMRTVMNALKPGGSLVIVDYDITPDAVRPPDKSHIRFGKAGVIAELEYIGFDIGTDVAVEGLSENYFVRFRKQ